MCLNIRFKPNIKYDYKFDQESKFEKNEIKI